MTFKELYNSLFFRDGKPKSARLSFVIETAAEQIMLQNLLVAGNTPLFTLFPHARRIFDGKQQVNIKLSSGQHVCPRFSVTLHPADIIQELFTQAHIKMPDPALDAFENNRIKGSKEVTYPDGHRYRVAKIDDKTVVVNIATGKQISPKSSRYVQLVKMAESE